MKEARRILGARPAGRSPERRQAKRETAKVTIKTVR